MFSYWRTVFLELYDVGCTLLHMDLRDSTANSSL